MLNWNNKTYGGYSADSKEGKENAVNLTSVLSASWESDNPKFKDVGKWSMNSIYALLGNGAGESGLNPWRWESDQVPTSPEQMASYITTLDHGYGLFGFTPANSYINQETEDNIGKTDKKGNIYGPNFLLDGVNQGNAQEGLCQIIYFMTKFSDSWNHVLKEYYREPFAQRGIDVDQFFVASAEEFLTGNYPLDQLVGMFELCYEKPEKNAAASSYSYRVQQANKWKEYLESQQIPKFYPGDYYDGSFSGNSINWLIAYLTNDQRRKSML